MKRELITKYVVIKTQKKEIEKEVIQHLSTWNDQELDSLVDRLFGLSTPGKILDLLSRRDA